MLAAVLEEQGHAFLGRHRYQRGHSFCGYRNGSHPALEVTVGLGPVQVQVPRVAQAPRDVAPQGFHSQVVQRYQRASQTTQRLFARLYPSAGSGQALEGLATGDFEPVFRELVGETTALSANPDGIGAAEGALGPGVRGLAAAFGATPLCLHMGRWDLPGGWDSERKDSPALCPGCSGERREGTAGHGAGLPGEHRELG